MIPDSARSSPVCDGRLRPAAFRSAGDRSVATRGRKGTRKPWFSYRFVEKPAEASAGRRAWVRGLAAGDGSFEHSGGFHMAHPPSLEVGHRPRRAPGTAANNTRPRVAGSTARSANHSSDRANGGFSITGEMQCPGAWLCLNTACSSRLRSHRTHTNKYRCNDGRIVASYLIELGARGRSWGKSTASRYPVWTFISIRLTTCLITFTHVCRTGGRFGCTSLRVPIAFSTTR